MGAEPALYRKVADDIKSAIANGEYGARTRLPSESELASRYGVSRGTIRQAFAALRADGVIASRQGARRTVIGGPPVQSFGELLSFSRWAKAIGEVPAGKLISMERRPASEEEASRLAIAPGTQVYAMVRVRLLSGRPVMIERGVFPSRVGSLVAALDLETESITERLEQLGIVWSDSEHIIDAIPASAEDARLLAVPRGVPMLRERRHTTDQTGTPVEWSDDRYLGSAVAFSVHNSIAVNALSRTPQHPTRLPPPLPVRYPRHSGPHPPAACPTSATEAGPQPPLWSRAPGAPACACPTYQYISPTGVERLQTWGV